MDDSYHGRKLKISTCANVESAGRFQSKYSQDQGCRWMSGERLLLLAYPTGRGSRST